MIATISIGGRQWDSDVTTSLHIAERIAIHMKNLLSITKSMHCVSPLVVLVTCAVAHAHSHIGVDTQSGLFGDPIIVKAGYLANESIFSVSAGRLMYGGAIATYQVSQQLDQPGAHNGAYYGDDLFLTSDFYYATGRLNGGNFQWEIASVTPLSGGAGQLRWGAFDAGLTAFTASAFSESVTRLGRSFDSLVGDHNHEQAYAFTAAGTYDVTFVVWDSNGRYADSAPLTVRFDVIPAPGAFALVGLGCIKCARRRRL